VYSNVYTRKEPGSSRPSARCYLYYDVRFRAWLVSRHLYKVWCLNCMVPLLYGAFFIPFLFLRMQCSRRSI
jgi:hypothetical protein